MHLDLTIEFTPCFKMNKDGYPPSEPSPKGRWYRNLIHWVSVKEYDIENIKECGEDGWEFMFYADSNVFEDLTYTCYVDVSDKPEFLGGSVCMTVHEFDEQFEVTHRILTAVKNFVEGESEIKFIYEKNFLQCCVFFDKNPDKVDPEYIKQKIYRCFEAIESVLVPTEHPYFGVNNKYVGDVTQFIS